MDLKRSAAEKALQFVTSSTRVLGLGTGSTAEKFLELLADAIRAGHHKGLIGVSTSKRTESLAAKLGIPVTSLDDVDAVDLAIDGADEIDANLNLFKGLGGALTREKVVARASRRFVIIADDSKLVSQLGRHNPLPVEILPFGWTHVQRRLQQLASHVELRMADGKPFITDQGNYILDCGFKNGVSNPYKLDQALNELTGVVEHGLFLDMAHQVVLASPAGVRVMERE